MRPGPTKRVVIAEDDRATLLAAEKLVAASGFEVAGTALDGHAAVDRVLETEPDVVLMDIQMPGLDGLEAARRIQEKRPTPVVVLTSDESSEALAEASRAGAGAYLIKPLQASELERAVTIAMARFEDLMELRRLNRELKAALDQVRTLRGMLPICAHCKKIRDDKGYWQQVESYLRVYSEASFSHCVCPDCAKLLYPGLMDDDEGEEPVLRE